jgi:hypothetical protein
MDESRPEHPIVHASKFVLGSFWGAIAVGLAGLLLGMGGYFGLPRWAGHVLCSVAFLAGVVALLRHPPITLRTQIVGSVFWLAFLGLPSYWGQIQFDKAQGDGHTMEITSADTRPKVPWISMGVGLIGLGVISIAAGVRVRSIAALGAIGDTAASARSERIEAPTDRPQPAAPIVAPLPAKAGHPAPPDPPQIEFITLRGLVPGGGTKKEERGKESTKFRDHKIFITNVSSRVIYDIELVVHFPEMVKGRLRKLSPEFVDAAGAPEPMEISDLDAKTDVAKVRSLDFTLVVKELAPQQVVVMVVRSEAPSDIEIAQQQSLAKEDDPSLIPYYVQGWYRYSVDSQGKKEGSPDVRVGA